MTLFAAELLFVFVLMPAWTGMCEQAEKENSFSAFDTPVVLAGGLSFIFILGTIWKLRCYHSSKPNRETLPEYDLIQAILFSSMSLLFSCGFDGFIAPFSKVSHALMLEEVQGIGQGLPYVPYLGLFILSLSCWSYILFLSGHWVLLSFSQKRLPALRASNDYGDIPRYVPTRIDEASANARKTFEI